MAHISVMNVKASTTVDGPGLRTAVYCAGCGHSCPGCHNPQTWDISHGTAMTAAEVMQVIERAGDPGVTFTGGDPMLQARAFSELAAMVKAAGKSLWCYTGFTFEECLADDGRRGLLRYVDVLVDGPFVLAERDPALLFRGSSNQRLVDVPKSMGGNVVLFDPSVGLYPDF